MSSTPRERHSLLRSLKAAERDDIAQRSISLGVFLATEEKTLSDETYQDDDEKMAAMQARLLDLQEEENDIVERIDDIDKAWQARKKPLLDELQAVRDRILEQEIEIAEFEQPVGTPDGPACLAFVSGNAFGLLCSLMIVLNLVMMVWTSGKEPTYLTKTLESFFLLWYMLELALKGCYFQRGLLLGDISIVWWNWLDLAIVLSGILDQWLMPLIGTGAGFTMNVSSLRALRFLRLFRIARALKLLRYLFQSDLTWINNPMFESFMMVVITSNVVMMWLELDYPSHGWVWAEHVVVGIYTFELCTRLAYHRIAYFYHEEWLFHYLDLLLVVFGAAQLWLVPLIEFVQVTLTGTEVKSSDQFNMLVKLTRVMRVARVLRLARLLRNVKPLYRLLNGVVASLTSIGWVILLTFVLLYSAAIVFTTLIGRGYVFDGDTPAEAEEHYGSVWRSFLSLFKLMNDDQSVVAPIITTVSGQILFYAFMMLSNWIMLAILTSVVSDRMMSTSRISDGQEKLAEEKKLRAVARRRMTELFQGLDQDNTGTIDEKMMSDLLRDPDLRVELCEASGLDLYDLVDVLHCVSYTGSDGQKVLLYRQFLAMLEGEANTARERSIFKLMERMRAMEFRQEQRLNKLLLHIGISQDEVDGIPSLTQELDKVRRLKESPAESLVRKITSPLSNRLSMVA